MGEIYNPLKQKDAFCPLPLKNILKTYFLSQMSYDEQKSLKMLTLDKFIYFCDQGLS